MLCLTLEPASAIMRAVVYSDSVDIRESIIRKGCILAQVESREQAILRKKAVEFLHAEIHKRYRIEYLEAIAEIRDNNLLDDISQDDIDEMEDLFTSNVYPKVEDRGELDKSFESMIKMLKRPHKLAFIIPSIPRIMMKHVSIFPSAMKIGLSTIVAYTLSKRLENKLVAGLMKTYESRDTKIDDTLVVNFEDYRQAYITVSQTEGRRMIGFAHTVMKAGENKHLVDSTREILHDVRQALIDKDDKLQKLGRPPQHTDDIGAISFGMGVIDRVRETYYQFSPDKMDRMIQISNITELHYMKQMYDVE